MVKLRPTITVACGICNSRKTGLRPFALLAFQASSAFIFGKYNDFTQFSSCA